MQKINIKWSKTEQSLKWDYSSHKAKYVGYHISEVINKLFRDGFISADNMANMKIKITYKD